MLKFIFAQIFLAAFNIVISFLIKNFDLYHVNNYSQELFRFGLIPLIFLIFTGFIVTQKLNLVSKYPILILILSAGVLSNITEKVFFGYVVDYLNFGIGVANIADIQIYLSCIIIIICELNPQNKSRLWISL